MVKLKSERECAFVHSGRPWFVGGQLLAMEDWKPDFVLRQRMIQKVVVWLCLPGLPLEFWKPTSIMAVAEKARRPISVDGFVDHLKKAGYARVRVELDAALPLKPGVLVQGKRKVFWQHFIYENLLGICFDYGRMGHGDEDCREVTTGGLGGQVGREGCGVVMEENAGPEGTEKAGMEVEGMGQPKLGPWLLTTRVR